MNQARKWLCLLMMFNFPAVSAHAQEAEPPRRGELDLCPLVERERAAVLEEAELERELAQNEYRARAKLFEIVDQLWKVRSIEREVYLDYERLRDRAKIHVARIEAQIEQHRIVVRQYSAVCGAARGDTDAAEAAAELARLQEAYRRAECEVLARDAQIARIDFEYDDAVLRATRELASGKIKTRFELVVDEFERGQSKARADAYQQRAEDCKQRLQS